MSDETKNDETTNAADEPVEVGNPITNMLHRAEQGIVAAAHAVETGVEKLGEAIADTVTGGDEEAAPSMEEQVGKLMIGLAEQLQEQIAGLPAISAARDEQLARIESKLDELIARKCNASDSVESMQMAQAISNS
jgi:hypothetical protein